MPQPPEAGSEFRHYLELIRRHLPTLVLLPLVAIVIAAAIAKFVQHPTWEATSELLVSPSGTQSLLQGPTTPDSDRARTVATEIQVLESRPVAAAVASQFPEFSRAPGAVPAVRAEAVGNTDVIAVHVRDKQRRRAAALATAYAQAYLTERNTQLTDAIKAAEAQVQQQIDGLQQQIANYDSEIAGATPDARPTVINTIGPLRDALVTQQSSLRDRLISLEIQSPLQSADAQLVQAALVPGAPVSPRKSLEIAIAGLAGLLIAVAVVVARESLDDRVHSARDVKRVVGDVPLLMTTPAPRRGSRRRHGRPGLAMIDAPSSPAAEALRSFRVAVDALRTNDSIRSILLTSVTSSRDSATMSADLAVAFARAGVPTLLVDADFRHPSIHELFRLENGHGLSDVIADGASINSAMRFVPGIVGLAILTAGGSVRNPSDLLGRPKASRVLASLPFHTPMAPESVEAAAEIMAPRPGLVVLRAPPILDAADAAILAPAARAATILIVANHSTRQPDLRAALETLRAIGAPSPAVILYG